MFKECGFIEKYGSGISRIKLLCKEHGLPKPVFREMQKGFKVIVYKEATQKTTKEKILDLLSTDNKLTRESLAQELSVSPDTIKQHLANLQKENRLKRVGGRKDGHWEVLDDK